MRKHACLGLLLVLFAAGCKLPPHAWSEPHYQPVAASGTVRSCMRDMPGAARCISYASPELPWVELTLSMWDGDWSPGATYYRLNVKLEKVLPFLYLEDPRYEKYEKMRNRHVRVEFDSTKIIATPAGGVPIAGELKMPYGGDTSFILSYQDFRPHDVEFHLFKDDEAPPGAQKPAYVDVQFPAVTIDGHRLEIPTIRFTHRAFAFY